MPHQQIDVNMFPSKSKLHTAATDSLTCWVSNICNVLFTVADSIILHNGSDSQRTLVRMLNSDSRKNKIESSLKHHFNIYFNCYIKKVKLHFAFQKRNPLHRKARFYYSIGYDVRCPSLWACKTLVMFHITKINHKCWPHNTDMYI